MQVAGHCTLYRNLWQLKVMYRKLLIQAACRKNEFGVAPSIAALLSPQQLLPISGCSPASAFSTSSAVASCSVKESPMCRSRCFVPVHHSGPVLGTKTRHQPPAPVQWLSLQRTMAGHSKWHNIRHIKGAKDAEKAKVTSSFSKKISACIRETGNADPKFNVQLARLVADAKAKDVPNSTIEAAIRQGVLDKQNSSQEYFDVKGPGGIMMVVETLTAKRELTKNNLKGFLKKHGFSVESSGSLRHYFSTRGEILVECQEKPNLDAFVDIAIDVGAEDVTLTEDEDGETVLKFTCEADAMYSVKKALLGRELTVESCEVVFAPVTEVQPGEDLLEIFDKVMDKMEEIVPEVVHVYTNIGKTAS